MLVTHCVRSIVETSTYENYEIVCVADDSVDAGVLRRAARRSPASGCAWSATTAPFNFSAKINRGAAHSEGEHLLLLNDDIEVATPDWIERMVMYSGMPEIGAVGGRLLWEDGRLQHVGVEFEGRPARPPLPRLRRRLPRLLQRRPHRPQLLAVTGACLMTRRELFEELGGFTTELPVNYNDIDYCLKAALERQADRLRPRPGALPLRVLEPLHPRWRNGRRNG